PAQRSQARSAAGLQEVDRIDELGLLGGDPKRGLMSPSLAVLSESNDVALVMEDEYKIWIHNEGPAAVFGEAPAANMADVALPGFHAFMDRLRKLGGPLKPLEPKKPV